MVFDTHMCTKKLTERQKFKKPNDFRSCTEKKSSNYVRQMAIHTLYNVKCFYILDFLTYRVCYYFTSAHIHFQFLTQIP